MAGLARKLVAANGLADRIIVIQAKVEEVSWHLPVVQLPALFVAVGLTLLSRR